MDDWYRPERFEFGEFYVDAEGELTLQFAGTLTEAVREHREGKTLPLP